jgi:hypothetical protein
MISKRLTSQNPAKTGTVVSVKKISFDIDEELWRKFRAISLEHGFIDIFWGTVAAKIFSLMEHDMPTHLDLDSEETALKIISELERKNEP